ncbi:MAG: hypothetical protein IJ463_04630 [Bacilli bacterium]|nr:hypothetical protein [Bacilli bacterium]
MGFIKDCIETKRKEREQARIEEMKRAALIELDRRQNIVIKIAFSVVAFSVACLLLAISGLDGEVNQITFMSYARVVLGVMLFALIPIIWIPKKKK